MLSRMAGAEGFEPPNVGTKNRCLTTWPRPSVVACKKARTGVIVSVLAQKLNYDSGASVHALAV